MMAGIIIAFQLGVMVGLGLGWFYSTDLWIRVVLWVLKLFGFRELPRTKAKEITRILGGDGGEDGRARKAT